MNTVTLTDKAIAKIKQILIEQNMDAEKTYVRVGIQGMSCSGPSYAFGLDESFDSAIDEVSLQDGLSVVNKKEYGVYLAETTVDYKEEDGRQGFTFKNMNPLKVLNSDGCNTGGCGSGGGCCGGGGCGS